MYLRALVEMVDARVTTVSSEALATRTGVNAANVRKDLARLGTLGTRGAGYDVGVLLGAIAAELGADADRPLVIAGVGNLGRALAHYRGFWSGGFRIVALLDADPAKLGEIIAGVKVSSLDDLGETFGAEPPVIAVVAVPADAAQDVVDTLVGAGITSILNFAPTLLKVPPGVLVRRVDLSTELQILGFYHCHRQPATGGPVPPGASGGGQRRPSHQTRTDQARTAEGRSG